MRAPFLRGEAEPHRLGACFPARPHAELGEDRRDVVIHGFLGYNEPFRDLAIAKPLGQQAEHLDPP